MSQQRDRGNALERYVAKLFGVKRVGQYGLVDVQTEAFAIECKERKTVPKWLREAVRQAWGHADAAHMPLVWLHQLGDRHDDDLVIMRAKDFMAWYGQ